MPYVKLDLPPGIVRPGTQYDARNRWYDCNLVRFGPDGKPQPVGGWAVLSNATAAAVGAPVRGMLSWRRNNGTAFVAIGTRSKLFVYSAGTLSDVTPSAYVAGDADASGSYYARTEAGSWQFDAYGEDLVACSTSDGRIVLWDSSTGVGTAAAAVTNAPTGCKGVVVTPERFLVALAASSDGRLVKWSDQEGITTWSAATTNQAGDFTLSGSGQIMAGRPGKKETLIWTDAALFAMRYVGGSLVYAFHALGEACGAISRRSMVMVDGRAFWMGQRGFYVYAGGVVTPIPSDVGDYVFNRITRAQASKIAAVANTDFKEVTWFYPASTENDSSVTYNYGTGVWTIGTIIRTDGIDRAFLQYPIYGSATGACYEHENGTARADEGGSPTYLPYIESGPIEIGEGDTVMHVTRYIPDEATLGTVTTQLYSRLYPTATETDHGQFTHANPTSMRVTARQVRVKHVTVSGDWRVGTPRLEVRPGGKR